jgi:hypothetical protein
MTAHCSIMCSSITCYQAIVYLEEGLVQEEVSLVRFFFFFFFFFFSFFVVSRWLLVFCCLRLLFGDSLGVAVDFLMEAEFLATAFSLEKDDDDDVDRTDVWGWPR